MTAEVVECKPFEGARAVLANLRELELRVRQLHRSNPVALGFIEGTVERDCVGVHPLSGSASRLARPFVLHQSRPLHAPSGAGYDAVRAMFNALAIIGCASIEGDLVPSERSVRRLVEEVCAVVSEDAVLSKRGEVHRALVERRYLREILADHKKPKELRRSAGTRLVDRLGEVLSRTPLCELEVGFDEEGIGATTPAVSNRTRPRKPRASRRPTAAGLIAALYKVQKLPKEELRRKPLGELVGERCEPEEVCGRTVERAIDDMRPAAAKANGLERAAVQQWDDLVGRASPTKSLPKESRPLDESEDQNAAG